MAQREERVLSAPIVFLDGRRLKVVPKSVTNEIPGGATARTVSSGGGSVEVVYGVDLEEMICSIKFNLPATAEYVELAQDYAARRINGEPSTIKIVEDTVQDHYDQCTLTNKISIPRTPDGDIEFEFMGRYTSIV